MKQLGRTIVQILGLLFSILILSFTGYQTFSLLLEVTKNPLIAALGLALFEGGMLYWLGVFKSEAESIMQMAISLLLFIFGLFLVGGATALHLGAVGAQVLGPGTPSKLITIAAIANLLGKTIYPIFAPETFSHIAARALEGLIMMKAYAAAETKTDDLAVKLAGTVGDEMVRRLTVNVLTSHQLPHSTLKALPHTTAPTTAYGDEPDGDIIEGETGPTASNTPANNSKGISSRDTFWRWTAGDQASKKTSHADAPKPPQATGKGEEIPRFRITLVDPELNITASTEYADTVADTRAILLNNGGYNRTVGEFIGTGYQERYTKLSDVIRQPIQTEPLSDLPDVEVVAPPTRPTSGPEK